MSTFAHDARSAPRGRFSGKALFSVTAWGASFVVTKYALECFHPITLVCLRLLAGSMVMLTLCRVQRVSMLPERGDRRSCVVLGLVLAAHLFLQARGLQLTTAINTSWIIGFIPVTIALGAWMFLRQGLRAVGWYGVLIATAGVMLVTLKKPPNFANARIGDLLQLSSCLTWTAYTLVAAGPVARNGSLRVSTMAILVATVMLIPPAGATPILRAPLTIESTLAIIFLGFICNGVAYYLWFRALDEHGPTRSGSYIYLEPFITLGIAHFTLYEPITINALLGGACVLIGVWMVARGSRRPPIAHRRSE